MKNIIIIAAVLLLSSPALAQQQPDIDTLQRAVKALYQQRNAAADAQLDAEVRASGLAADLAKALAKIKETEAKPAKPKDEPSAPPE